MRILMAPIALLCLAAPLAAQEAGDDEVRATGLTFLDEQSYRSIPLAATPLMGDLPAEFDMAADFPVPGYQGNQPSCVGWAVAYALKSYQERRERNWDLGSPARTFSPAFIYNRIRPNSQCVGGSHFVDALNVLRRDGVATLADFPYDENDCSALPSEVVRQNARDFAIADWRRVNVQDETEIKTQLAAGFPVMIGAMVDARFQRLGAGETFTGAPGPGATGHAMVVTGYSDSRGAFKVINSWGTRWADGGFGWIDYAAFRAMAREGYVVQDIIRNQPTRPGPDPAVTPEPGPGPGPTPPTPQPAAQPVVTLGYPQIVHNQLIASPTGPAPGIRIQLSGHVAGARGRQLQILARFSLVQGTPLFANAAEPMFRDIGGLVATGTPLMPVGIDDAPIDGLYLTIPYYALNLQPSNFQNRYNLSMTVVAYLDNQAMAQAAAPFDIQW